MRRTLAITTALLVSSICFGQQGKLTMTFTPILAPTRTITADMSGLIKNTYASNDYTCYWFINPHTNLHHVVIELNNKQGGSANFLSATIELNSTQNDFEFWDHPHPNKDSNFLALNKALFTVSAPLEYDEPEYGGTNNHNPSMKVHISIFTPSEIEFTITGCAEYGTKEGDGKFLGYGNIQIHGHFYRQGVYEKSPVYPGCGCDPTIYAQVYDIEEGDKRTASECEAVLIHKLFNTAKQAFSPVYGMSFNGAGKAPSGAVTIRKLDHYDVSPDVPAYPAWPFDYNYKILISRGLIETQKRYYNNGEYGLEMDEMASDADMSALKANNDATISNVSQQVQSMGLVEKQAKIDSLARLMKDKQITMQQYSDGLQKIMAPAIAAADANQKKNEQNAQKGPDFNKMNMETMMLVELDINPRENNSFINLDKAIGKADVQVLHTVAGSAYVIRVPSVKDGDGNWAKNKCYVLLGKYNPPVVGRHDDYYDWAVNINPLYPAGANKLLVYNIVIKMEGGADQIEKALTTIDFASLEQLINHQ